MSFVRAIFAVIVSTSSRTRPTFAPSRRRICSWLSRVSYRPLVRDFSILCGVFSSLLYAATDVAAAIRYEGYSYAHQAVSELSAIDAPTRPFVVSLFTVYNILVIAFAAGIATAPDAKRSLRITG